MGFEIINKLKKERGLTNAQLAQMSGVTLSTLDKITSGANTNPKLDTLQAICRALGCRLDDFDDPPATTKKAPSISDEAIKIAKRYQNLDSYGKATVRAVMDEEENRISEQSKLESLFPTREPKVINLFCEPSAAGIATPVEGKDYEAYELTDSDPQGAAYAVRIQGNSMEPHFPDGSIVFVNHDAIRDGDIGIFCVDGGTVCKQYYKRGGVVYLFSLNRQRADADVVLAPGCNRTFLCQGKVITRHRFPLPHEL